MKLLCKIVLALEYQIKRFIECLFLILMGIVRNQRNLPFHMPIVCSLFT
jgi:hypothetical protein